MTKGQACSSEIGYVPLPEAVVGEVEKAIERIEVGYAAAASSKNGRLPVPAS